MKPITPEVFALQWVDAHHLFSVALNDFEVRLGGEIVDVFQESFVIKKFNDSGAKPWHPWDTHGGTGTLMLETGTLRNSIKVRPTMKAHDITVWTDPTAFGGAKRHKGFCYAAVHNNFDQLKTKPARNGRFVHGPKHTRQFMGDSSHIGEKINDLERKVLFKNMP